MASAAAVHAMFDHLDKSLPTYVPAMPSILFGTTAAVIVLALGVAWAWRLRAKYGKMDSVVDDSVWVLALAAVAYAAVQSFALAKSVHYGVRSIAVNKQHFANVHWVERYAAALRAGFGPAF
jgi:hypothetical protein